MQVVISQSMLFPWVGLLEQIRLADVFVHYDDVQFSKGSLVNRVQLKMPDGPRWMTIPLQNAHLGQRIDETQIKPASQWRELHLDMLKKSFSEAPFAADALALADEVYSGEFSNIGSLARSSLLALANYYELDLSTRFIDVKALDISGTGTNRVLKIVTQLQANRYITGHGAAKYLDHASFERAEVEVSYMNYRRLPYPQRHGVFNPHVTGLDLVANCGREGIKYICSGTKPWREFIDESTRTI